LNATDSDHYTVSGHYLNEYHKSHPGQAGTLDSNTCPAGSVKMASAAQCEAAAVHYGKTFNREDSWSDYPAGCFWNHNEQFYFNTHSGASSSSAKPLCATKAGPQVPFGSCEMTICFPLVPAGSADMWSSTTISGGGWFLPGAQELCGTPPSGKSYTTIRGATFGGKFLKMTRCQPNPSSGNEECKVTKRCVLDEEATVTLRCSDNDWGSHHHDTTMSAVAGASHQDTFQHLQKVLSNKCRGV